MRKTTAIVRDINGVHGSRVLNEYQKQQVLEELKLELAEAIQHTKDMRAAAASQGSLPLDPPTQEPVQEKAPSKRR